MLCVLEPAITVAYQLAPVTLVVAVIFFQKELMNVAEGRAH